MMQIYAYFCGELDHQFSDTDDAQVEEMCRRRGGGGSRRRGPGRWGDRTGGGGGSRRPGLIPPDRKEVAPCRKRSPCANALAAGK